MTQQQEVTVHQPRIIQEASPALTPYTKAWVRRLILMSFVNFIIAGTVALFMRTDQASLSNLLGPIGTPGAFGQLESAHGLGMFVGWQFPFTYGLCMYILPKYMKRRIYHERLLPWMFYTFLVGFYMVWLATLYGFGAGWYFLFPLPVFGGPGASSPWDMYSAFLFFIGMIVTNISLVIFVVAGFGTVFSTKYHDYFDNAPGKLTSIAARIAASTGFVAYLPKSTRERVVEIPVAVIGVVVTMFDMIISLPPFMALLFNGAWASIGNPPELSNLLAKNFLWLNYHPIVYFAFFPLVGMYYTLLPIFAKKAFQSSFWVRAPWPLLLIPGVGVYSHHLFMDTSQPFFLQIMSQYMTMIIAVGSGISVFTLIGLLWRSKFDWNLTARWIIAAIFGWVLGGIIGTELGNPAFDTYGHNTYMVLAHFHYNALCGIVFAAFGFLYWAFPEFTNKKWYSNKLSEIHFWMMIVGAFGMVTTFAAMGYIGVPRREFAPVVPVLPFTDMYNPYLLIAAIFAFIIAVSLVFFIVNIIMSLRSPSLAPDSQTPMPAPELDIGVPGAVSIISDKKINPEVEGAS
jgi:heme/copper-type cytochrome/quinol oxidase subunit 1